MAANDSTQDKPTHPLVSVFPEDTLTACSQVLTFLSMYSAEDCPCDDEKQGLSIIHHVVKSALDYEIGRIGQLRKGAITS